MKNPLHQLALVAALGLVAATTGFAQPIVSLEQPDFDTGLPVANWAWQSFTVSETSLLTTVAFRWNGGVAETSPTATVDLLTGEGTNGTLLASTIGSVSMANSGPYQGNNFFNTDFNNLELLAGQYTVYVHDPTAQLEFIGTDYNSYSGGKWVCDYFGDSGYDATFFMPSPVPEPSTVALTVLAIGLLVIRRRQRRCRTA